MPVVDAKNDIEDKASANKGFLFVIGVVSSIVLWLVGYGSNMLVYTTENFLPAALPILLSLPVAWLVNRISKVYPGSAAIFLYAVLSVLGVILGITTLTTLSTSTSWTEISVGTAIIGFVYPLVALGYPRWLEVFIERLGLSDGEDNRLQHIDTLVAASKLKPREVPARDFSKAVKVVGEENGIEIIDIDLDELENAARPVAHQAAPVVEKPKRKPAARKTTPKPVVAEVVEPVVVEIKEAKKPAPRKPSTPRKTTTTPRKPAVKKPPVS